MAGEAQIRPAKAPASPWALKPALRAARAKRAIPAGFLVDVVDLLQPAYHRRAVSLQSVTGRAQDAVTGRVVSELILAEQAGPDRGAALRARHIGRHSGLLTSLDVLDLEVAAVGNHRDAVRAKQFLGWRRGLGQQAHVDNLIADILLDEQLVLGINRDLDVVAHGDTGMCRHGAAIGVSERDLVLASSVQFGEKHRVSLTPLTKGRDLLGEMGGPGPANPALPGIALVQAAEIVGQA